MDSTGTIRATGIRSTSLYDYATICPRCGRSLRRTQQIAADGLLLCRDCREIKDKVWLDGVLGRSAFRPTTDEELAELEAEAS